MTERDGLRVVRLGPEQIEQPTAPFTISPIPVHRTLAHPCYAITAYSSPGGNMRSVSDMWPALPYEEWKETYDTLHMWVQVVGKVALAQAPPLDRKSVVS